MPKELTQYQLRKIRAELIDKKQDDLSGEASFLQNALYDSIVERFLDLFETDKGIITFNDENIKATEAVSKIFEQFNKNEMKTFLTKFVSDVSEITDLNIRYHKSMADDIGKFRTITDRVTNLMSYRLGINDRGQLTRGGFLDSFIKDTGLLNSVKNKILDGVTKQISQKDMLSLLKTHIKGDKPADGAMIKRFKAVIGDTYSQYDKAMSKEFATDLKLKAFIYSGGIINDSREFCIKKNNKVFTIDEAEDWVNDPDLPRTLAEQKSGVVVGYDPLINMGRWMGDRESCRHRPNFISNAEAIRLRPDLEGIL